MSKKHKPLQKHQYSKPIQEQIEDIDYWNKLNKKDAKLLKQFIDEYYGNNHQKYDKKKRLLKTKEVQKEATRWNNSSNRDAYDVAKKSYTLDHSENDDKVFYSKENISDWIDAYKVNGHKAALDMIINESLEELDDAASPERQKQIMIRFFIKMRRYFSQVNKEKKNE